MILVVGGVVEVEDVVYMEIGIVVVVLLVCVEVVVMTVLGVVVVVVVVDKGVVVVLVVVVEVVDGITVGANTNSGSIASYIIVVVVDTDCVVVVAEECGVIRAEGSNWNRIGVPSVVTVVEIVMVVVLVVVVEVVVAVRVVKGSMVCARKEKDGNRCLLSCQCGCDILVDLVPEDVFVIEVAVVVDDEQGEAVVDEVIVVAGDMVEHVAKDGGGDSEGDGDGTRLKHGGDGDDVDIVGQGDGDDGVIVELLQEFMAANGGESGANVQTGTHIVKHSYAESLQGVLVPTEKG